jgi:hypothetical protein
VSDFVAPIKPMIRAFKPFKSFKQFKPSDFGGRREIFRD